MTAHHTPGNAHNAGGHHGMTDPGTHLLPEPFGLDQRAETVGAGLAWTAEGRSEPGPPRIPSIAVGPTRVGLGWSISGVAGLDPRAVLDLLAPCLPVGEVASADAARHSADDAALG